jgi:hypothetical protein
MQDNSKEVYAQIAQFILNSSASSMLTNSSRNRLENFDYASYANFRYDENTKSQTEATIDIDIQPGSYEPVVDECGNEFTKLHIENIGVSWPSHGSSNVDICKSRLNFYSQIVQLAEEIQAKFGNVEIYELYQTKEESDKRKSESAALAIHVKLDAYFLNHSVKKHLRVNQFRHLCHSTDPVPAPVGTYYLTYGPKSYEVEVGETLTKFTRTA